MDVSKELNETTSKKSFVNHVFNMEDESQKEILNIIQYSLLALIPVLLLNKTVQTLFPEADESKNNMELLMEIAGQTVVMFVGMLLIHRFVTYVPTYSKVDYSPLRLTNVVIAFLTIVLSIQSRIGEKANILFDRVLSYFRPHPKEAQHSQQQQNHQTVVNNGNIPLPPGGMVQNVQLSPSPSMNMAPQGGYNTGNMGNMSNMNDMDNMHIAQTSSQPMGNDYGSLTTGNDGILAANEMGSMWGSAF